MRQCANNHRSCAFKTVSLDAVCLFTTFKMSSGGWEIVGKNKKDKNAGQPVKHGGKNLPAKQTTNNAPKIEDILPLNQVKTLYNIDGNKTIKKSKEGDKRSPENDKKRQQKQKQKHQQSAAEKKKVTAAKPKAFKTLEDAMEAIDREEIYNILETNRARFPDTPWVWLEDLATFLNKKLIVEKNPVYPPNPKHSLSWPLCAVPKSIRAILEKAIDMTEESQAKWFHKSCYMKFWKDAAEDSHLQLNGYKILFQLLLRKNLQMPLEGDELPMFAQPESVYTSSTTFKEGAPQVFWALLQYGYKDLATGLSMWQRKLSSNLYNNALLFAKPTAQLFNRLILCHEGSGNHSIDLDLFLDIYATVCSKTKVPAAIESTVEKTLSVSLNKLRNLYLKSEKKNLPKVFESVIGKITPKIDPKCRKELVEILSQCLTSADCHSKWRCLYLKHLYPSSLLLVALNKEHFYKECTNVKTFRETFVYLDTLNKKELKANKQKGQALNLISACNTECEAILKKMTVSSQSTFPWKKGSILLLLLIGGVLALDYQKHGSFEASNTGKFIKNSGLNVYTQKIWHGAKTYFFKGLQTIEANFPEYYKVTVEFLAQYAKLAGDLYLIARNVFAKWYHNLALYVEKSGPVVKKTIDHYVPGLIEEIHVHFIKGSELFNTYISLAADKISEYTITSIRWLESNVFVGKLSPESLQNYASRVIDTTQTFASQTYDWVYEKVQTLSKVP